jgi:hypothetical protein
MPIVVDAAPVIGGTEEFTLDGLELNDGVNYGLLDLRLPIPARKPEWVEGADSDGAILLRDPLRANGQMVATIDVLGSSRDDVHQLIRAVTAKLAEASRHPGGIECDWTPKGGSTTGTFFVLHGEVTELPLDDKYIESSLATITVTMDCRPGMYGPRALYATTTSGVTGPQATVEVENFPGDMTSDEAELIITDTSSQSRRWAEWGAEWQHYNTSSPAGLVIDSDSLVTSGYSGVQGSLSGAYDPNATGNNIISATVINTWQTLAATAAQAHVGTFRVKARVNSGPAAATSQFRFAWRVGDDRFGTLPPVVLAASAQAFYELDLGIITIPEVAAGTQSWEGRVDAYGTSAGTTLYLDYIKLVPASEGYGRAATSGGSWVTSGATGDFKFADSLLFGTITSAFEGIQRQQLAATAADTGPRYAILGSTNYTSCSISVAVRFEGYLSALADNRCGLLARWTDASNHLRLVYKITNSGTTLLVEQIVGGVSTVLASSAVDSPRSAWRTLVLSVFDDGTFAGESRGPTAAPAVLTGYSDALKTGGTLASGEPGVVDYNIQTDTVDATSGFYRMSTERNYDDFWVATLQSPPVALYSGRTLEVRSATTERQSSGGTGYGRPNSYRGSRFLLKPAGVENRVTRVAASAYRNDVDNGGTAEHISDALKLEVYARPRYSVVP